MSRFSITLILILALIAAVGIMLSRMDTSVPTARIEKSVQTNATSR